MKNVSKNRPYFFLRQQLYVSGGNGADSAMQIKEQIKALFDELYQEAQEKEYSRRAMQRGYA